MQPQRAVAYIRVSTNKQDVGPKAQQDEIETWCAEQNVKLVGIYRDIGFSGSLAPEDRPGLLDSIQAVKDRGVDLWVVAKRDRMARDVRYASLIEIMVERNGGQVVSAEAGDRWDDDDPMAVMFTQLKDVIAQYERMLIRSRVRAAMAAKKRRGERVGTIPYGFTVDDDGKTLLENPVEQQAIQRLVELHQLGTTGLRSLCRRMDEEGHPTRSGKPWHPTAVKRILSDYNTT